MEERGIKVIFAGPICSGKTLLRHHLCGENVERTDPTIGGVLFKKRGAQKIDLNIWDLTGSQIYNSPKVSTLRAYIRGSHVVVFFFDPRHRSSFRDVFSYISFVNGHDDPQRPFKRILLGHKYWHSTDYEVSRTEAASAASEHNATYFELLDHSEQSLERFLDTIISLAVVDISSPLEQVTPKCKVLFEGAPLSGKNLLLNRLHGSEEPAAAKFCSLDRKRGEETIKVEIWDTEGHRQFFYSLPRLLHVADVVVFFFDPASRDTFESALRLLSLREKHPDPQILSLREKHADPQRPFKKVLLANYFRTEEDVENEVPRGEAKSAAFLFDATFWELPDHSAQRLEEFLDAIVELTPPNVKQDPPAAAATTGWRRFFRK